MRKIYITVLAVLTCIFALGGLLAAADWYREDRTTNIISVGELSAEIVDIYRQGTVAMPGDEIGKIVSVRNDGASDEYVRVRLSGVWDDSGNAAEENEITYEINTGDWVREESTGYYYYTKVLKPGETSEPLMYSFALSGPGINNYYSHRPGSITVAMEAVQAAAGGASIWNGAARGAEEEREGFPLSGEDYGAYVLYEDGEIPVAFRGKDEGFSFGAEGDLFRAFKNILPGQTVIQNISVENESDIKTEIYLRAVCEDEGVKEQVARLLTEYAFVKVSAGGETVYKGPVRNDADGAGDNGLYAEGICLGEFETDGKKALTVELELAPEVDNEFSGLAGEVDWIFSARGTEKEPVPQTGDEKLSVYFVIMLISGGTCILLVAVKKIGSLISERRASASGRFKRPGRKEAGQRGCRVIPLLTAVAAVAASVALGTGITMAFMTDGSSASNSFTPGTLKLDLEEPSFEPDPVLSPGISVPKDPVVTNTGSVAMLTFITVGIPIKNVRTVDAETKMIIPAAERELFSFEKGDDWALLDSYTAPDGAGGKNAVYVYGYMPGPLEPGAVTSALFTEIRFLNVLEGELEYSSRLDVKVDAYGVQARNIAEGESMEDRLSYGYENFVKGAT